MSHFESGVFKILPLRSPSRFGHSASKPMATDHDVCYRHLQANQFHFNTMHSNVYRYTAAGTLPQDEWTHVAATYNADTGVIYTYINGAEVSSQRLSAAANLDSASSKLILYHPYIPSPSPLPIYLFIHRPNDMIIMCVSPVKILNGYSCQPENDHCNLCIIRALLYNHRVYISQLYHS